LNDNQTTRYSSQIQVPKSGIGTIKGARFSNQFEFFFLGRVLATPPHLMMIKLLMVADDNFYFQISLYRRVLEPRLGKQLK